VARPDEDPWPFPAGPPVRLPPPPRTGLVIDADEEPPTVTGDRGRDRVGASPRERLRAARRDGTGAARAAERPVIPVRPPGAGRPVVRAPLFMKSAPSTPPAAAPSGVRRPDPWPEEQEEWPWPAPGATPQRGTDPFGILMPAIPSQPVAPADSHRHPVGSRHARRPAAVPSQRRAWRMPAVTGAAGVLAGIVLGVTGSQHAEPVPAEAAMATPTVTVTAPPAAPITVTAPAAAPVTVTVTAAAGQNAASRQVWYADCEAVRREGAAPLYRGEPGYRAGLDPDGDGIACEHA